MHLMIRVGDDNRLVRGVKRFKIIGFVAFIKDSYYNDGGTKAFIRERIRLFWRPINSKRCEVILKCYKAEYLYNTETLKGCDILEYCSNIKFLCNTLSDTYIANYLKRKRK